MPTYQYKSHQFNSEHDLSEEEFSQVLAHLDSLPPKQTTQPSAMQGLESIEPSYKGTKQEEPNLLEKLHAGANAGLATAHGMAAYPFALASGLVDKAINPESDLEGNVGKWSEKYTSQTDDPLQSEYQQNIAKALDPLNALAPMSTPGMTFNPRLASKAIKDRFKKSNPDVAKAMEMEKAKQESSQPLHQEELPLDPTQNPYGVDTSKFVPDENGIPVNVGEDVRAISNQKELFGRNENVSEPTPYAPMFDTDGGISKRNGPDTAIADQGVDYWKTEDQQSLPLEDQYKGTPFDPAWEKGDALQNPVSPNAEAVRAYWRKMLDDKGIAFDTLSEQQKGQLSLDLQESMAATKQVPLTDLIAQIDQKIAALKETAGESVQAQQSLNSAKFGQGGAVDPKVFLEGLKNILGGVVPKNVSEALMLMNKKLDRAMDTRDSSSIRYYQGKIEKLEQFQNQGKRVGNGSFGQGGAVDWSSFLSIFPAFKESAVKEPLYHGSTKVFEDLKGSKEGGALGNGTYLAVRPEYASTYADQPGGNIHQVYVNIRKPLVIDGPGDPMINGLVQLGVDRAKAEKIVEKAYEDKGYITNELRSRAQKLGYDGIIQKRNGQTSEVVAFNADQVKSAISPKKSMSQLGIGKKQRGSFTPFASSKKPPSFESYRQQLERDAGRKFSDDTVQQLYKEKYGDEMFAAKQADQVKAKALSKIPGLKSAVEEKFTPPNEASKAITPISTRALMVHPEFGQRLQGFEKDLHKKTSERLQLVDHFLTTINKSGDAALAKFNNLLLDNNYAALDQATRSSPEMAKSWGEVKSVLASLGKQLKEVGLLENLRENYIPNMVKDYEGLLNHIGVEKRTRLERMLKEAESKAHAKGLYFGEMERSDVINKFFRGKPQGAKPGFTKARVFETIPEDLKQFYASPTEAIHSYIRTATDKIETAKFFGKTLVKDPETGKMDINSSIGKYTDQLIASKKIKPEAFQEMHDVLQARFGSGAKGAPAWAQTYGDVNHLVLMGDVANAIMQTGDIGPTVVLAGVRPTLQALYMTLRGDKVGSYTSAKEMGLMDHIAEEFAGERGTTRAVRKLFRATGLSYIDGFMKTVNFTANRIAREAEASGPALENTRLYKVYAPRFGERFPQLVADLKSGKKTPLTDEILWSELSHSQPISRSEYSSGYLNHPNTRPVYNLKSFLLKQIDFLMQTGVREIKRGNVKQGIRNLAMFALVTGTAGVALQDIKDVLQNKPLTYKMENSAIPLALLNSFGLNKYFSEAAFKGNIGESILKLAAPPLETLDPFAKDAVALIKDDKKKPFKFESMKTLPVVGDEMYGWSKYGKERRKMIEKNKRAEDKKQRKNPSWLGL